MSNQIKTTRTAKASRIKTTRTRAVSSRAAASRAASRNRTSRRRTPDRAVNEGEPGGQGGSTAAANRTSSDSFSLVVRLTLRQGFLYTTDNRPGIVRNCLR